MLESTMLYLIPYMAKYKLVLAWNIKIPISQTDPLMDVRTFVRNGWQLLSLSFPNFWLKTKIIVRVLTNYSILSVQCDQKVYKHLECDTLCVLIKNDCFKRVSTGTYYYSYTVVWIIENVTLDKSETILIYSEIFDRWIFMRFMEGCY